MDYQQFIEIGPGFVSHDIAWTPNSTQWSFPLTYESNPVPCDFSTYNIDGVTTNLSLGEQTVQGSGTTVALTWGLGAATAAGFTYTPFDGELFDLQLTPDQETMYVFCLAPEGLWQLSLIIEEEETSPVHIALFTNGSFNSHLLPGEWSFPALSGEVGIIVSNLTTGLKVGYTASPIENTLRERTPPAWPRPKK